MSRHEEIRTQVERILSASEFSSSYRLSRLLQYLVDHHLSDPQKSISEYQLSFEVFERPSDFDPQIDSVVRVQTARLRQKLATYYADTGQNEKILIEIPRGKYAVNISFREIQTPSSADITPVTPTTLKEKIPITLRPKFTLYRTAWLVIGLFILIAAAVAIYARTSWWNKRPLEPTAVHFTYYPGLEDNASFAPDGRSVAFSGSSGNGREIFIKEIDSGKLQQITHDKSIDINPT